MTSGARYHLEKGRSANYVLFKSKRRSTQRGQKNGSPKPSLRSRLWCHLRTPTARKALDHKATIAKGGHQSEVRVPTPTPRSPCPQSPVKETKIELQKRGKSKVRAGRNPSKTQMPGGAEEEESNSYLVATYSVMNVELSLATFGGGRADRASPKSQTWGGN